MANFSFVPQGGRFVGMEIKGNNDDPLGMWKIVIEPISYQVYFMPMPLSGAISAVRRWAETQSPNSEPE